MESKQIALPFFAGFTRQASGKGVCVRLLEGGPREVAGGDVSVLKLSTAGGAARNGRSSGEKDTPRAGVGGEITGCRGNSLGVQGMNDFNGEGGRG